MLAVLNISIPILRCIHFSSAWLTWRDYSQLITAFRQRNSEGATKRSDVFDSVVAVFYLYHTFEWVKVLNLSMTFQPQTQQNQTNKWRERNSIEKVQKTDQINLRILEHAGPISWSSVLLLLELTWCEQRIHSGSAKARGEGRRFASTTPAPAFGAWAASWLDCRGVIACDSPYLIGPSWTWFAWQIHRCRYASTIIYHALQPGSDLILWFNMIYIILPWDAMPGARTIIAVGHCLGIEPLLIAFWAWSSGNQSQNSCFKGKQWFLLIAECIFFQSSLNLNTLLSLPPAAIRACVNL